MSISGQHLCSLTTVPSWLFIPPFPGWLRTGTLAHPWAATVPEQRAPVFPRSRPNCPLPRMLAGPRSGQERRRMERPTASRAFFHAQPGPPQDRPRWLFREGWHTEPLSSLSLCQTRHFGRRGLPSSSRLSFLWGSMPSHSVLPLSYGCFEGLSRRAGLSSPHPV